MLDTIVPKKVLYYLDLIRFNRPIGFMLLMWPCWFALATIPQYQIELILWYAYFIHRGFFNA